MPGSRVANNPVYLPKGVDITEGQDAGSVVLTVKGKKGTLSQKILPFVRVAKEDTVLRFSPDSSGDVANTNAGTMRALVNNMVQGVDKGFERKLLLVGVGYRVQIKGNILIFSLGHSHPVEYRLPTGMTAESSSPTELTIAGIDKQKVGQVAAELRAFRPPEPYKGKGVRYAHEVVIIKETKKK